MRTLKMLAKSSPAQRVTAAQREFESTVNRISITSRVLRLIRGLVLIRVLLALRCTDPERAAPSVRNPLGKLAKFDVFESTYATGAAGFSSKRARVNGENGQRENEVIFPGSSYRSFVTSAGLRESRNKRDNDSRLHISRARDEHFVSFEFDPIPIVLAISSEPTGQQDFQIIPIHLLHLSVRARFFNHVCHRQSGDLHARRHVDLA